MRSGNVLKYKKYANKFFSSYIIQGMTKNRLRTNVKNKMSWWGATGIGIQQQVKRQWSSSSSWSSSHKRDIGRGVFTHMNIFCHIFQRLFIPSRRRKRVHEMMMIMIMMGRLTSSSYPSHCIFFERRVLFSFLLSLSLSFLLKLALDSFQVIWRKEN